MIPKDIEPLLQHFEKNPPCEREKLREVERALSIEFPKEYLEFMFCSNGGEGSVGASYLSIFRIEEIVELHTAANFAEFFPGLVLFGSDGGGETYVFDYTEARQGIVAIPGSASPEDQSFVGSDFWDFLRRQHKWLCGIDWDRRRQR